MLTDLPRVEFGEEKITKSDIEEAKIREQKMKERIKSGKTVGLSMKNLVSSNAAFLQNKAKKGD